MKEKMSITHYRDVSTLVQNAIVKIVNVNIALVALQKSPIYCIVIVLWVKRLSERSSV